jgi:hypothetical protein
MVAAGNVSVLKLPIPPKFTVRSFQANEVPDGQLIRCRGGVRVTWPTETTVSSSETSLIHLFIVTVGRDWSTFPVFPPLPFLILRSCRCVVSACCLL